MSKKRQLLIRLITLGDQVCFSVANFVLSITLARFFSETDVAAFVIGMSIALTIQGIQRNCYVVQNAVLAPEILRRRAARVMGQQAIAWGILVGFELLVLLALYLGGVDTYFLHIGVATLACTLMCTQLEFDRIMFVKHDKYWHAAATSVGFFLMVSVLFYISYSTGGLSFAAVMGLVSLYMVAKMLFLFFCTTWPDFFWGWRLLVRDFRKYFKASVVGVVGYAGYNHVPVFILGSFAAPIQTAAFGVMRGLMQPLQIIVKSLDIIDKNVFQRLSKEAGGMRRVFLRQLTLYSAVSVGVVVCALGFGGDIIRLAYGEKYVEFTHILVGWAMIFSMLAITLPLETVIVKLGALNKYNYLRIISGVVGAVLSFVLLEPYGAMGAVMASFAGWLVSVVAAFWLVRPVLRKGGEHG